MLDPQKKIPISRQEELQQDGKRGGLILEVSLTTPTRSWRNTPTKPYFPGPRRNMTVTAQETEVRHVIGV